MRKYYTSDYQLKLRNNQENFRVWSTIDYEPGDIIIWVNKDDFIDTTVTGGEVKFDAHIELGGKHL